MPPSGARVRPERTRRGEKTPRCDAAQSSPGEKGDARPSSRAHWGDDGSDAGAGCDASDVVCSGPLDADVDGRAVCSSLRRASAVRAFPSTVVVTCRVAAVFALRRRLIDAKTISARSRTPASVDFFSAAHSWSMQVTCAPDSEDASREADSRRVMGDASASCAGAATASGDGGSDGVGCGDGCIAFHSARAARSFAARAAVADAVAAASVSVASQ